MGKKRKQPEPEPELEEQQPAAEDENQEDSHHQEQEEEEPTTAPAPTSTTNGTTPAETLYQRIKFWLGNGKLKVGDKIPQDIKDEVIAQHPDMTGDKLAYARAMRSALAKLAAEGLTFRQRAERGTREHPERVAEPPPPKEGLAQQCGGFDQLVKCLDALEKFSKSLAR